MNINESYMVYPVGYLNTENVKIPFVRFFETEKEAEIYISDFYFKNFPIGADDLGLNCEKVSFLLEEEYPQGSTINDILADLEKFYSKIAPNYFVVSREN